MAGSKHAMREEWLSSIRAATLPELLGQLSRTRAAITEGQRQERDLMAELADRRGKLMANPEADARTAGKRYTVTKHARKEKPKR